LARLFSHFHYYHGTSYNSLNFDSTLCSVIMLGILILYMPDMKSPHHFSLEEDDDQISIFYSRERLIQLIDFLRDNTSGPLQVEIIKFASALLESQTETAGKITFCTLDII